MGGGGGGGVGKEGEGNAKVSCDSRSILMADPAFLEVLYMGGLAWFASVHTYH